MLHEIGQQGAADLDDRRVVAVLPGAADQRRHVGNETAQAGDVHPLTSALRILTAQPSRPFENRLIGRQQHGVFDQRRRNDDAIARVATQTFEISGAHRDLCR